MKKTTLKASRSPLTKEYVQALSAIKKHVQEAQVKTALSANKELLKLYWYIGQTIEEKQSQHNWGTGVIEQLVEDLQNEFPGIEGFSKRNIFRMRAFYLAYEKVPQPVAQITDLPIFNIPWGHNAVLLEKIKDNDKRFWYAQKTIEDGWSRGALEASIKLDLYSREGKAITNFKKTLPDHQSGVAQQALKDPYIFDFLSLAHDYNERDLEQGLIDNVQKTLLELGKGFAFIGRQYHLEISATDFYIDLLFYHYKLRCFVVVELKARPFDPRDAGQLNFYLSAIDSQLRHPNDNPTIGLLLCKTKDNLIAEYALRDINKPIGVAGYETELVKLLPKTLKSSLPTIEELEAEFEKYREMQEPIVIKKQKTKPSRHRS